MIPRSIYFSIFQESLRQLYKIITMSKKKSCSKKRFNYLRTIYQKEFQGISIIFTEKWIFFNKPFQNLKYGSQTSKSCDKNVHSNIPNAIIYSLKKHLSIFWQSFTFATHHSSGILPQHQEYKNRSQGHYLKANIIEVIKMFQSFVKLNFNNNTLDSYCFSFYQVDQIIKIWPYTYTNTSKTIPKLCWMIWIITNTLGIQKQYSRMERSLNKSKVTTNYFIGSYQVNFWLSSSKKQTESLMHDWYTTMTGIKIPRRVTLLGLCLAVYSLGYQRLYTAYFWLWEASLPLLVIQLCNTNIIIKVKSGA